MKITDELLEQYAPEAAEQMLSGLPEDADLPRHRFSPEFERKVRCMDKKARPQWQRWLRSTVAAVLACAILGGFCVTPAGAYVYEQVWQFVKIHVVPEETSMAAPISFGYLPEGFELVSETEISNQTWVVSFRSEEGYRLEVMQWSIAFEDGYDKELHIEGSLEKVTVNDIEYWLIRGVDTCELYWIQDGCEFLLSGNLSPEIMLKIGTNVSA